MMKRNPTPQSLICVICSLTCWMIISLNAVGQCGLSAFAEPGGVLIPTTSWQSVSVGSGTYAEFSVAPNNIYQFRYTNTGLSGYAWDMTVSNASSVILYDNNFTPTRDPWTGGICPVSTRPQSTDFFSTFSGTIRINTHAWDGFNCNGYVPGLGSAILEYRSAPAAGDPGPGINVWHVEAFATANINIPQLNARYGYYLDNNLSFNTQNFWSNLSSPSSASTWVGSGLVPNDIFVIRARRQGFPCNRYRLVLQNADDEVQVILNGNTLFTSSCCIGSATTVGDVNGYILDADDVIEVRTTNLCQPDNVFLELVPLPVPPVNGGVIGGIADSTALCEGQPVGLFTNVTPGSGGVSGFNGGGTLTYSWQFSINGGPFTTVSGVNTPFWNVTDSVPVGSIFAVRRVTTDLCGNEGYSNVIHIIGRPKPFGNLSPTSQSICQGQTAVITVNFTQGTGPFTIQYYDGVTTTTKNNVNNGDTIQVSPPVNTTYTLTYIQDSYGCQRSGTIGSGAQVLILPPVTINSVTPTPVSCFGGNNGTITINATTGGGGSLEYSIDGGATFQTSNVFTGLAAGPYNIVVKNSFGCVISYSANPVIVTQPTDITHTTSVTDASCTNVLDGSIAVSATGGVPPYAYSLNGGPTQPGSTITGVGAGTYTILVFDANGCVDSSTATVNNVYNVTVTVQSQTNLSCFGANNGSVTVQLNGGSPPFSYSINGITFQPSGTFSGLAAGTYTIVGKDVKGCTEFATVTITQPAPVTVVIDSVKNLLCNGGSNGAIYITASGGTSPYNYLWSNASTAQDLTGVSAGTYNVTVTDANGCTGVAGATISQPNPLFVSVAIFNHPTCFGDSTGAIDITVNGGTPPYTHVWSNGATSEDLAGLLAGTYSVTVTDANGCVQSLSQTLVNPTPITTSTSGTNVTCFGAANGTATVNASGGNPPYSFNWSNFGATPTVTGLGGGKYYVTVTDNKGCTKRDSVTISEPPKIVLSFSVTNAGCGNNGAITLNVTGGVPGYTFAWSNGATTQNLSGLPGGTYCVTVTDATNCTATGCVTFTQPPAVYATLASFNHPLCHNDSTGAIDITASGGIAPYTFAWSNGHTLEDLSGVPAGSYTVTVTDANGCTASFAQTLLNPTPITSSVTGSPVTCHGAANGSATLTVSGGNPPYTFQWSNFATSQNVTGLPAGLIKVIITDNNGCTKRDSVLITQPAPLQLSLAVTQITCHNANNGAINLTVSGGTPSYTYLWSNSFTTEDISGLAGGTYTVTVKDANNCIASAQAVIINPQPINTSFVVTDVSCNGQSNGAIDFIPSGGTAPYTYVWSNSAVTQDISGLSGGTYTVTLTDSQGCSVTGGATVNEPDPLFTSGFIKHVTCANYADGCVDITAYGGTLPYFYAWSNGPSTEDICNVSGGNYTVTVTDAKGCQVAALYVIFEPAPLSLSISTTNVSCPGGSNGSAQAVVGGGRTPYTFLWSNFASTQQVTGLPAGKIAVLVTDSMGCQIIDSAFITQPQPIQLTANITDVFCGAQNTGAVDLSVTGGTPPYSYIWAHGPITQDISSLTAGLYTVTVFDANGCTASQSFKVIEQLSLGTNISVYNPSCNSGNNGFISVYVTGGLAPYDFTWSTQPVQKGSIATNLSAGTYTVTITDSLNCSITASATLIDPLPISLSVTGADAKCYNTATGYVAVSASGGTPPYLYELNGIVQVSDTFHNLAPGNYVVAVRDANGCQNAKTFTISSPAQVTVSLSAAQNVILQGMSTQIVANASSTTTPIVNYFWGPVDSLFNFSNCADPTNCSSPYVSPYYTTTFTVAAMNADSCMAYDTITIIVELQPSSFIPTAFTPNGDGLNDRFEVDILGATNIDIEIYDRWGAVVYKNPNQPNGITGNNGWDGTLKDKAAPFDTYLWKMKVTYFNGLVQEKTGTVNLMR
ncbi:MAG: gliding motility-associated C-terminal domain-containing protein [Chitinophagales bacterium]|nr:gliding motility-associated C-terminal domain-containing protein [Chitinophagales bacterium]MDW8419536.1 gliding motility-associated C-terminal domain-containing protein [Chitinophagales bacterium]